MKYISCKTLMRTFLPFLLLTLLPGRGVAGIMIGGTRFIYNEKSENGISFLVRNTDETPFLIQTKVLPYETGANIKQGAPNNPSKTDFVATPPLLPLRKKQENYIRIIRTGGGLPADRESLFQLSVAAIPSGKPDTNDLQVAIRSNFKLIYRPANLKGLPDGAYQQLLWLRSGNLVSVENPTPYYVTLFRVVINGKALPAEGVVPPYGSRTENWCPAKGTCQLQWQSLNDMGTPTEAWNINPIKIAQPGKAKI